MISIIVAMSNNRIIGAGGATPWNIPADMRRFRQLTLGHTVIMGRKTFESIGHPLQGRTNIVVSRQPDYCAAGVNVVASLAEALRRANGDSEIFICGGGELYAQALPIASRIYLTWIDAACDGDTCFPPVPADIFVEIFRERLGDALPADFIILERAALPETVCSG